MAEQALGYHPFLDPIPYKEPKVQKSMNLKYELASESLQDHFRMPGPHLHARTTFACHDNIRVAGPRTEFR